MSDLLTEQEFDTEARDALLFSTDLEARLAAMFASIAEFGEQYDEPSDDLDGYPSGEGATND